MRLSSFSGTGAAMAPAPQGPSPGRNPIPLSELAGRIKSVLSDAFAYRTYWVVADVTDHKYYPGRGTHYFSLAEKHPLTHALSAKLAAVAWSDGGTLAIAAFQQATGEVFRSGIRVLVQVAVAYHQQYGLQLVLRDIDAAYTIGQLEQQRLEVLARLLRECPQHVRSTGTGYITSNSALAFPRVIQQVAVVTSSQAAGYADFRSTLEGNRYGYQVRMDPYFTTVQGEAHAERLCRRLAEIRDSRVPYDAVIIIRGGGAQTDLLLFNQYDVAAAVAAFPIPVISGIGHQINETLTDLMAHTAVKTPSIAAETILARNRAFEEELTDMRQRIIIRSQQMIGAGQQQLTRMGRSLSGSAKDTVQAHKDHLAQLTVKLATRPLRSLGRHQGGLEHLAGHLAAASRRALGSAAHRLTHYQAVVQLMSPESILKRGFAIITRKEQIITDPTRLQAGEQIVIRMDGGAIDATVATISNEHTNTNDHDL